MGYPMKKKRKKTTSAALKYSEFKSVVVDVVEAEGFLPRKAFTIKYRLTKDGKTFTYKETFVDTGRDPRTAQFLAYLKAEGYDIEDLNTIVGMQEELGLYKEQEGPRVYLSIRTRKWIGHKVLA